MARSIHQQAFDDPPLSGEAREHDDSWLQPARGIAIGVLLGLCAWSLIGLAAWALLG